MPRRKPPPRYVAAGGSEDGPALVMRLDVHVIFHWALGVPRRKPPPRYVAAGGSEDGPALVRVCLR